ncbi:MAG: T9SS type A sorting domain-containing protein [Bacteroidales bacterium]|nr:T9SS type A sorting domain-containing protein [Bacteroidales bacterium]
MKNIYLVLSIIVIFAINASSQIIYSENFDDLTTGEGISQQLPDNWTTWNNNPGSAEDGLVSEAYAVSGTKSLAIGVGNDVVMDFDILTANRYKMSFKLYIPTGKAAFYSPMQTFDPATSTYNNGMQIFFLGGSGTIDGGGSADAAEFSFAHDTWLDVVQYFDLDNQTTDVLINSEIVYSGNWSNGISYFSNTLQGFDLYGWDESATPEFYFDDIVFEQVPSVYPATDLTYEIQNSFDVNLTWVAPASSTPESYYIYRNDVYLDEVVGQVTFTDNHLYPGVYEYYVVANYGSDFGVSTHSNTVSVEIVGGTQRQLAILELFTGTECTNAGFIESSLMLLASSGLDYKVLSYFNDEDFAIESLTERQNLYVPFFDEDANDELLCPSSIVNGMFGKEGYIGSLAEQKAFFQTNLTTALNLKTLYTITPTVTVESVSPYTLTVEVSIEELIPYYQDEIKVFAIIAENDIEYSWQGNSKLKNLVRIIDNQVVDFSQNTTQLKEFEITVDNTIDAENCDLVIFLQNSNNANILEAYSERLTEFISVEQFIAKKSEIYPNPVNDIAFIKSTEKITSLELINNIGQTIIYLQPDANQLPLDLSNVSKGIYFIKINTQSETEIHKLIVQ